MNCPDYWCPSTWSKIESVHWFLFILWVFRIIGVRVIRGQLFHNLLKQACSHFWCCAMRVCKCLILSIMTIRLLSGYFANVMFSFTYFEWNNSCFFFFIGNPGEEIHGMTPAFEDVVTKWQSELFCDTFWHRNFRNEGCYNLIKIQIEAVIAMA